MTGTNLLTLIALSAIWGGSFLLLRIGVPQFGPVALIESRLALAALFLSIVALVMGRNLQWHSRWRHYLLLGGVNSALPFLLLAFSAQTLSASLMSILNATTPIWGALLAAIWGTAPLTRTTGLGLVLGLTGVAILVGFDAITLTPGAPLAIAASLSASLCYAIASMYARGRTHIEPFDNAHGSLWGATLAVLPLALLLPPPSMPQPSMWGAAMTLGVLCTAIAYLMYFRLVKEVGAAPALTVTFLVPVFGVLWGHWLLGEVLGLHTMAGSALVIWGTVLVTGFSPRSLIQKRI
ncbi:DMT family transporter [Ferrimonas futtsuensis]|uniref:DMT family transporter n=1 Tax=Ferrimonas futtsuensis TaxID=364764 RepID=UPI000484595A|nr:DMT family transporter [Ferrimonas futtsuensis]